MSFVALVTGGNKGIGFEIVKKLCEHIKTKLNGDGIVFLGARNSTLGEKAVKDINDVYPNMTRLIKIDVTDNDSVGAAAGMIDLEGRKLDVLVNNAGFAFKRDATDALDVQFPRTFDVNYFGVRKCMDAFLPLMKSNGRIVILSSSVSKHTWEQSGKEVQDKIRSITSLAQLDDFAKELLEYSKNPDVLSAKGFKKSAYGNSKLFVTKLTELYAKGAPTGVLINCAHPGWCKSDMAGWEQPPQTAAEGAETPVMLALLPASATSPQGEYWSDGKNDSYLS